MAEDQERDLLRCRLGVALHAKRLMAAANINGAGVGYKEVGGVKTDQLAVAVFVTRKIRGIPEWARIPRTLDIGNGETVITDVVESGPYYPTANTGTYRPVQPGCSVFPQNINNMVGTFGAVVFDPFGNPLMLSNNHVLANVNSEPIGAPITQPALGDDPNAGVAATLTRYVTLVAGNYTNLVDAAVATPSAGVTLSGTPLNGIPTPNINNPAVGLLFANDYNPSLLRTLFCPMLNVLQALNVTLPANCAITPALGQKIQKTGRTTGATYGTINYIGMQVQVPFPNGTTYDFGDIFQTDALMGCGGDSGSVAVLGGPGQNASPLVCPAAAEGIFTV